MANWNGNWELTAASNTYQNLIPGGGVKFSLAPIAGAAGVYKVGPFQGGQPAPAPAVWNNCIFLERAGSPGPFLPWPMPPQPTTPQLEEAGKHVAGKVRPMWQAAKMFERLEGDVDIGGTKKGVVLYRAVQGMSDGGALLVAILLEDLTRVSNPDGSASGRSR